MNTIGKCFPELLDAFLLSTSCKNVASEFLQSPDSFKSKPLTASGDEHVMVAITTNAKYTHKAVNDLVEDVEKQQETNNRNGITARHFQAEVSPKDDVNGNQVNLQDYDHRHHWNSKVKGATICMGCKLSD